MKNSLSLTLFFFSLFLAGQPGGGQEQEKDLGQLELSVTEAFQAQVMKSGKLNPLPNYEDTIQTKLTPQYRIESQPLPISFSPEPISPARIARVEVEPLYQGLVELGYGLYNSPVLEAHYASGRSGKRSYGFTGSHFSTQDGVPGLIYDKNIVARNSLGGFYKHFYRKLTLHTDVQGSWNRYNYYGIPAPDNFPEQADTLEPPYNWYRRYAAQVSLTESSQRYLGWLSRLDARYHFMDDRYGSQENNAQLQSSWRIPADDRPLFLEANVAWFGNEHDSLYTGADSTMIYDQQTFQAQLNPHFTLYSSGFRFDFGLDLYLIQQQDSRPGEEALQAYFFPEIEASYPLVPNVLTAQGGITGQVQRNTYHQLIQQNPFFTPGMDHLPSRTLRAYLGLEGKLGPQSNFSLESGFKQTRDQALAYRSPTFFSDSVWYGLQARYATVRSWYASGEISTHVRDKLQIDLNARLQSLETEGNQPAWHLPWFTSRLAARYSLAQKINIATQLQYIGPRQAFRAPLNPQLNAMLEGYLQLNLEVDYQYNERISAFLRFRNLLNQDYQLYLGYPAQQLFFQMGFGYRF
ncbi:MAG: hypothetical protein RI565_05295 [Schleiferiaceae bacterium]|nr:hypothetical protein [Schleiferiaceae bacterium]